jgi:aminopeptidase
MRKALAMDAQTRYHQSLIEALNPARGRPLLIRGELAQSDSMHRLEAIARKDYGACPVHLLYIDPLHDAEVVRNGDFLEIDTMYDGLRALYREVVSQQGAMLRLTGSQYPDLESQLAAECPDAHQRWMKAQSGLSELYRDHGINKGRCTWLVAGAAVDGWARKVYPHEGERALDRLWQALYQMTQVNATQLHQQLQRRCNALNSLGIDRFRVQGPGTDWTVGLQPLARFRSGGGHTADGRFFQANLPSFEVWVTPDRSRADGEVTFTMPFLAQGVLVEGLKVRMEAGAVVECQATRGLEEFKRHIAMDESARYGGEFALVGIDSPIYSLNTLFYSTLYDENAACHWAFGSGYADCLEGGQAMSPAQLQELGCNSSKIHTDAMWGSDKINVTAITREGREVPVLVGGAWQSDFV